MYTIFRNWISIYTIIIVYILILIVFIFIIITYKCWEVSILYICKIRLIMFSCWSNIGYNSRYCYIYITAQLFIITISIYVIFIELNIRYICNRSYCLFSKLCCIWTYYYCINKCNCSVNLFFIIIFYISSFINYFKVFLTINSIVFINSSIILYTFFSTFQIIIVIMALFGSYFYIFLTSLYTCTIFIINTIPLNSLIL